MSGSTLPRNALGEACDYASGRWGKLRRFLDHNLFSGTERGITATSELRILGLGTGVAETDTVYLPPGELTAVLGISDVEISRLARRGILPRIQNPEKPKYYLYPLLDCCREYIRHLKSRAQKDKDDYWSARAKRGRGARMRLRLRMPCGMGD